MVQALPPRRMGTTRIIAGPAPGHHEDPRATPPAPDARGGAGAPGDPVRAVAQVAGNLGHAPPFAINVWPNNPCSPPPNPPPDFVQTCTAKDITVGNPQASSGGVDQHTVTI